MADDARPKCRFERLLGASIEPLLTALTEELAREGKRLGGRKAHKSTVATRPHLLRLTRTITMREKRKSQQQQLQQQLHPETGFIDDRYQSQVRREEEDTEKETTKTSAFEQREEGGVSTTKVVGHGWEITPLTTAATASTATTCRQTVFDRLWELYEAERAEAATNLASDMVAGAMSTAAGSAVVSSARNDTTETRSRCLTDDLSAAEAAAATATAAEQAPDSHVAATGVARKHPPPANATDTMVGTPESAGRPSSSHGETRTSTQGGVFPEWGMQPQRPSSAWAVSGGSGGRRPHRSSGLNERNVGVDSQEMMNVDHDVMDGGVTTTSATTDSTTRGARFCWESKPGPRRGDEEVGGDGSDELDDDEEGDEVEEVGFSWLCTSCRQRCDEGQHQLWPAETVERSVIGNCNIKESLGNSS